MNLAKYAYTNGTYAPGQHVNETNFLGFIGGNYAALLLLTPCQLTHEGGRPL